MVENFEELSSVKKYDLAVRDTELSQLAPDTPPLKLTMPHGASICATGLVLPDDLDEGAWIDVGRKLLAIDGTTMKWALGDWWAIGQHKYKYGERAKAAEELAEELDYKFESLMNLGWVARKVPTSLRNEALNFTHHKAVAKLTHAEQKDWLERAVSHDWTAKELAQQIKDHETDDRFKDDKKLKETSPVKYRIRQSRKTAINAIYEFDKVAKGNFFLENYIKKITNDRQLVADLPSDLILRLIRVASPHAEMYNNLINALKEDQERRADEAVEATEPAKDKPEKVTKSKKKAKREFLEDRPQ